MSFLSKKFLMIFSATALITTQLLADVTPCTLFQNNMVLQRDIPVPVWGTASPGEEVTVSFAGQTLNTKADSKGDWTVTLKPLSVQREGTELVIKGKNLIKLQNVVVGDVWLCSGQSNMEMNFNWGVMNGTKFVSESEQYPLIRDIKFAHTTGIYPLKNPKVGPWNISNQKNTMHFSAAAYFFAKRIFEETNVPIGILDNNWSGCRIEIYIPPCGYEIQYTPQNQDEKNTMNLFKSEVAKFKSYDLNIPESKEAILKELDVYRKYIEQAEISIKNGVLPPPLQKTKIDKTPNFAYYAMIAPITRFPIKGALWYQGCSNGGEGDSYYLKMRALINGWRTLWKQDFPVYYVQLAAYTKATDDPAGGNGYARIREAQRRALDIPKTGMACTIDIGMEHDIHPKNKIDVGNRLALWALRDLYGKNVVVSGPLFKSMKIEGSNVRLSFDYAEGLMTAKKNGYMAPEKTPGESPRHFAVAGADKVWYWADARIEGSNIVLSCDKVPAPVAVRYAYRAYPKDVNVYNAAGLPMVPFRTDNW